MILKNKYVASAFLTASLAAILILGPCVSVFASSCQTTRLLSWQHVKEKLANRPIPNWQYSQHIESNGRFHHYAGEITVEAEGEQPTINFHAYYTNKNNGGKSPTIFLFPGMLGINFVDHHIAMYFATRGVNVVISHYRDVEREGDIRQFSKLALINLRASLAVIDAFVSQKEVDASKLALMGYSFGGIRAAYIAALDDRFKAIDITVASGSLSKVMAYSKKDVMEDIREKHMRQLMIADVKKYEEILVAGQAFEPIDIAACKADNSHYNFHISTDDNWVLTPFQLDFHHALRGSHADYYDYSHVKSVLIYASFFLGNTLEFFRSRWKTV